LEKNPSDGHDYYTSNWLTLVILCLITEVTEVRSFILQGPSTWRAQVQCTSFTLLL